MHASRGTDAARLLTSGPARLTQAFGIARPENGVDLVRDPSLFLLTGAPVARRAVVRSTRVGVNVGIERRWRFFERGSPFVSPGRPSVPAGATGSRSG
jgi:DNA-3-methyladenine glycosylase